MKPFSFRGEIPASKSMMNRALLVQSYFPQLEILGDSNCDDVHHMKLALEAFKARKEIFCGEAGTVIRFMALRASREHGGFQLTGSPRLLSRPQKEVADLLAQVSVSCEVSPSEIRIQSSGWKKPASVLKVQRETSSQFATSLLLNSWQLPFDLEFEMKSGVSEGYWQMSVDMAKLLGMEIQQKGDFWKIPAHQQVKNLKIRMEPDYSSAFAISAAGALAGEAIITNATEQSFQPDYTFVSLLGKMGATVELKGNQLAFRKADQLKAIEVDLASTPDLFPVLSVVCAFADGVSFLKGAPHLVHKESDRLSKTAELLKLAGVQVQIQNGGMQIHGNPKLPSTKAFVFDTDQDHRMAMAAGLLKLMGFQIEVRQPEVVSKSYPDFWKDLGVKP